ncbi:Alpha-copaene synthase [Dendrobium catenatum]|uniref:Alpha-copaene synthase n=1 Tax=Dendrobium catenatum TaxID=906689 RepID=A0A2I0VJ43_9ASPA|nr:Alpha-copaene synthase [Dendrobium catenatum]
MIDAIHHLGVAYHFEFEINDALKKIHRDGFEENKDLHTIALGFRLLRQQRFRWKNSMALSENLPFDRDRLVELHFWMTGTYFEPSYSRARIMVTKLIVLTSILDDIYDQYGTLEDLELLTEKIER